jgi:DNA-binding transcriptional LysR family regulator
MAQKIDRGSRCAYRSLTNPTPTRTIRMIWHKDRYQSPIVQQFIQSIRAAGTLEK